MTKNFIEDEIPSARLQVKQETTTQDNQELQDLPLLDP